MKKIVLIFTILILVSAILVGVFWRKKTNPQSSQNVQAAGNQQAEEKLEAINGVPVNKELAAARPLAVIIENHPDARPQSGLSSADVVYETLAEGGITRFLAIFQSSQAKAIGPVRSAREYFAEIADEWGALFAHVGGSNEVINQLKNNYFKNLSDANEYYNFDFFPRNNYKPQPHHIFTSVEKLRELIKFHDFSNTAIYTAWKFKSDQPADMATAKELNIDFSRAGYEVGWQYDALTNSYKRLQYFEAHMDEAAKKQITAKNVVAQIVNVTPVPKDPLLHVNIDMDSGGKAIILQDGKEIIGTWKKQNNRTHYYNEAGQEVAFNRGPIWIELVPQDKESKIVLK
ncbi:MAG: DUF3048 domain-containing protein [Candidatus Doudnabacteria bacterium]|nr:DUF3048 domain-containing protein [Candidatus Doudnabacteria bacterium]